MAADTGDRSASVDADATSMATGGHSRSGIITGPAMRDVEMIAAVAPEHQQRRRIGNRERVFERQSTPAASNSA